ncbi:phosphoenolpyruvate synthase [Desulfovibrio sp. UIB00]|uniref:PEP/pyruvate-binding domain-containing protein n=1 Tax=Desulfovibrio sp. UIB00 TaxID=2804314 RepID=UPI001F0E0378|nr:PEP/pyruvate-binding domain-containing protein [Desulfovibrio sp. UIB00]MCH5144966.1 phosphoenolpyruvate synthase [Desulfovibrio sp. UIB00]
MTVLDCLRKWLGRDGSGEPDAEQLAREEAFKAHLRERCTRFRRLLSSNKTALEAMSDVEEHLSGARPFGMDYVHAVSTRAVTAVFQMVRDLNALSDEGYEPLQQAFDRIREQMQNLLEDQPHQDGPNIMPLGDIRLHHITLVGGKMANLGEVAAHAGLDVPDGFAVTVSAYYRFMEYSGLHSELNRRIQATDMHSLDEVFSLSAALQQAVLSAPLPPELEQEITEAVAAMQRRAGPGLALALRSSAVGEDSLGVSFAGQYRSELNVPPEEACEVWKEIIASKYAVTAMSYRYQHGIPDDAAPMCVGVLAMVPAAAGGVAYSRDPVAAARGQEQVLLNAVPGLPQAVVDGAVTPDVFIFTRTNPPQPISKTLAGLAGVPASLTDAQAADLAQVALALEEYYAEPQDVEWALDSRNGRIVVLQSRPLHEADAATENRADVADGAAVGPGECKILAEDLPEGLSMLACGGVAVSPGVGMGPVFVARKEADMLSFPKGGILVVERALPRWAPLLSRASGMVSETGGMAGHLASVAREYRLPAVFSLPNACSLLDNAGDATLDAVRCAVFAGLNPELAAQVTEPPNLMEGSPVHQRLEALATLMVPLHLLDPESPEFAPEHCQTLHDITRFCHEKSVQLMFEEGSDVNQRMGKQLKAGVKLQYWIVDMGGGFRRHVGGAVVDIADIASTPMLALWDGMVAVPWAGPPAASASGFMSVMLESTMNPDLESTAPNAMSNKNFFIISDNYMILQARYGYHFCTVESLAGANNHENFVSFQFKGGAADRQRRRLRARMVADLLEAHGFRADVKDDSLFAVAENFPATDILQKTRMLGYLLIHTRQVDMIMLEQERAAALREKLGGDMASLLDRPLPSGN